MSEKQPYNAVVFEIVVECTRTLYFIIRISFTFTTTKNQIDAVLHCHLTHYLVAVCYMEPQRPSVLILGGCGYIGRNLVQYLLENDLAGFIRVADKILPAMAYLHPDIEPLFESSSVQVVQCDLTK